MQKVLLHTCCAPCGGYVIRELQQLDYEVLVLFYNPNISPVEEYELRLAEVKRFCEKEGVELLVGEDNHVDWLEKVKGLENEPERGKRCEVCFALRLSEAAQVASEEGCVAFATTLTISPHKDAALINQIGQEMAGIYGLEFIDRVWRKEEGFKKSCALAEQEHFHRQDYCGCEFSIRNSSL